MGLLHSSLCNMRCFFGSIHKNQCWETELLELKISNYLEECEQLISRVPHRIRFLYYQGLKLLLKQKHCLHRECISRRLVLDNYRPYDDLIKKLKEFLEDSKSLYRVVTRMVDEGCMKTPAKYYSSKMCHAHKYVHKSASICTCHETLTQKSETRQRHFFSHCQCGKCSLHGIINNICPNGYVSASLSSVYASVYPAIAADNGVPPADRGPAVLLLPCLAKPLVRGPVTIPDYDLFLYSVDSSVKSALESRALGKTSPRIKLTEIIDLSLVFSDTSLSCNDQLVHTHLCCTTSSCSTKPHSLTTAVLRESSQLASSCILLDAATLLLLESLSSIQLCVNVLPIVYDCKPIDIGVVVESLQETISQINNKEEKYKLSKYNNRNPRAGVVTNLTGGDSDTRIIKCVQEFQDHQLRFGIPRLIRW